ncbi:MAG: hypothetical protein ACRDID_11515 [Ktedonobacterales bacterium]
MAQRAGGEGTKRYYERHGWSELHLGFVFKPGDQPFVVMRRELEESRAGARRGAEARP